MSKYVFFKFGQQPMNGFSDIFKLFRCSSIFSGKIKKFKAIQTPFCQNEERNRIISYNLTSAMKTIACEKNALVRLPFPVLFTFI